MKLKIKMPEKRDNLFGTDGIRGKFNEFPLNETSIKKLGHIIGKIYKNKRILMGRDTRESGKTISELLIKSIGENANVTDLGIAPTPLISYLTKSEDFYLGIAITASHNPYYDNGIKFFNSKGEKIEDKVKDIIVNEFYKEETPVLNNIAQAEENKTLKNKYIDFIIKDIVLRNNKQKILIDTANGAAYEIADEIFSRLNLNYKIINNKPNGKNINDNCGSTHIDKLRNQVLSSEFDIAISFDGDGDRVLFMDSEGNILDGDYSLLLISDYLFKTKNYNKIVIGTIMSNLRVEEEFNKRGVKFYRSQVGDEKVYKLMIEKNAIIGGENSGHTILLDKNKTGDGILISLYFLKSLDFFSIKANTLFKSIKMYPQKIESFYVNEKPDFDEIKGLNNELKRFYHQYKDSARMVLRYSGTEPKIRLMIEAINKDIISKEFNIFKEIIINNLGEKK